jgi:D-alanyl-D-alanine endopeptidase (penicillin-binding protein 7)
MVFRARSRGAWLLALLVALPTMTVGQPTPAAASKQTVIQNASTSTKKSRRSARRRARKPPPGGVYARNAVVMDPSTGEILYEKNGSTSVPIASLTKLMTAMVFLDGTPDLERSVAVSYDEIRGAGRTRLRNREIVELGDLLHMSLMCSDNCATRVIVRESGFTMDEFLARMNRKASELGLAQTKFVEVTGLDEHNVSSAADCARLLRAAAENPTIHAISTTPTYEFRSATRPHTVVNTNRLLVYHRYEVLGGKTGFINEAGYCFATWIRTQGRDLIAVVLGAPTAATRFADVVRLVQRTTAPAVSSTN